MLVFLLHCSFARGSPCYINIGARLTVLDPVKMNWGCAGRCEHQKAERQTKTPAPRTESDMKRPYGTRSVTFEGCDGRYLRSLFFLIPLSSHRSGVAASLAFFLRPYIHQLAYPINHRGEFQRRVTAYTQHTCRS